jgi:cytochrome c oxidase cbb3-type subunit 3
MNKELKSKLKNVGLIVLTYFLTSVLVNAQSVEPMEVADKSLIQKLIELDPLLLIIIMLMTLVMLVVVITMSYMVSLSSFLINEIQRKKSPEGEYVQPRSLWAIFKEKYITGTLYESKVESNEMVLDHEYDGIKELDYGMPPWLSAIFIGTVVFAIAYLIQVWGIGNIKGQISEYEDEVSKAEITIASYRDKQANLVDENSVAFLEGESDLSVGKEIFLKECRACHADDGGGGVGPNLTDNYWIHGGDIQSIFATIKYGVPEKGMISWQTKLNPSDMQKVSSYILTLVGTNPKNPKEPQGEEESNSSDVNEVVEEEVMSDSLETESSQVSI